ncbi:serine protease [Geminocystis herdmanii]|uniref:serine protease n=1 Tax=Geminocystis herdmanii TaxID=669359 RepID=UPI00034B2CEF|nr:serine protease [Geminocystis herdmanii]
MNLNNFISPFVIGVATLTVVQPQMVFAQTRQDINIIAKSITVRIDGREYGTGTIINREGNTYTVLTNMHVVGHQGKQQVTTFDGKSHEVNGNSIKQINKLDLALFQFTSSDNYGVVEIANEQLKESTNIYITGYPAPRPGIDSRIYQFTEGYISGINPQGKDGYTLVYTNQTRPGMSGGPILNTQGKLVGIHGLSEGTEIKNTDGSIEIRPLTDGYKLGIPINNYLAWANNNQVAVNTNLSNANNSLNESEVAKSLNVDEYLNRAKDYYEQGEYEKAIDEYNQALKINPNFAESYFYRGSTYGTINKYDNAISDLNQALKINPTFAHAYLSRGIIYANQQQYTKAISDLNEALKINPNFAYAYYNRGTSYLYLKQYEKALSDLNEALKINPNYAEAYNNRGISYFYLKQYEKALSDLNEALKINPNYAEAYNNRGRNYARLQQYEKSINDYNQALKFNPNYAKAYLNRGIAYTNLQRGEKAISDFNQALKINPNYAEAYAGRATGYLILRQYKRAITDYQKAQSLFLQQGDRENAEKVGKLIQTLEKNR